MADLIREVVSIRGEPLEFVGIIYLENGVRPKAMLLARFSNEEGLLGFRSHADIENLTDLVHDVGRQLALLCDCEMDVTPVSDSVDMRGYSHILLRLQHEWEQQRSRQKPIISMN